MLRDTMAEHVVTPEDFMSVSPPARMIGIECEYNLQTDGLGARSYVTADIIRSAGIKSHGSYLGNGGKLYVDVGDHPEYDTPECLGPRQVTIYKHAGVLVMQDIIGASNLPHRGLYLHAGTTIRRPGNITTTKTSGTHKNYLAPRQVTNSELIDRLLPGHLATRMYAMGGKVGERYEYSQKAQGIGGTAITRLVNRRTDHGNKPMVMIPPSGDDIDTIGNADWARVEVRLADPVMSPVGEFMDTATTSLVLRLIEHPHLISPHLAEAVELAEPAQAAKIFSRDLHWKAAVTTVTGKQASWLSVQRAYAEAVAMLPEFIELPEDELDAIDRWVEFCDLAALAEPLEAEYGVLANQYDFAARHSYLAKKVGIASIRCDNPNAVQRSLLWDRITPTGGSLLYWQHQPNPIYTNEEVQTAKSTAPPTRALIRASVINGNDSDNRVSTWAHVARMKQPNIVLADSYETNIPAALL
ncbi:MAG: proteasome accessory factor PafA2 family protein [Candidatus Saccharimonadales bacterium]